MKPGPDAPHILLVDDNSDGLLVRRSLLEDAGFGVTVAKSGEEGIALFERGGYDLVITDFRMPGGMDGVELISRIRKMNATARIILLSGFVEPLGLTEDNTCADAVIAKTSNEPTNLVRTARRLVNRPSRKPAASQTRTRRRAGTTVSNL
jgi:CheY-like chemotaxis protein